MTILFSTFGSLGDIHPFLALALEANSRGHHAILATSAKYRLKIESLGIEFRAIRPDLPAEDQYGDLAKRVMDGKGGPEYLFRELLNPTLRQNYADLLEAAFDADLIVTHPAALGGPLAAQKLRKKWVSSALAPISLWSIFDPPTPPTLPALDFLRVFGAGWGIIYRQMGRYATQNWLSEIRILRRQQNLPDSGHPIFEGQHSPWGVLALFSPFFCAPQKDWPRRTQAVGFPFFDATGFQRADNSNPIFSQEKKEHTQLLQSQFLQTKPIIFTLGSSAVWDAGSFFHLGAQYARNLNKNAIFLTGQPTKTVWPPHVLEIPYAPYSQLFPQASLVVHQGGIGTTAQCLRAGVPQLVMPYAHDQNDNARRVDLLRVGSRISRAQYSQKKGGLALSRLSEALHRSQNAQILAQRISAENAAHDAVSFLETTL